MTNYFKVLALVALYLAATLSVPAQTSPRPLPVNLGGVGLGMPIESVTDKLGPLINPLRLDPKRGLHWTTYMVEGVRLDLYFSNSRPMILKQMGITFDEPVVSTEFGIRADRMYFNPVYQYFTYRRVVEDQRGTPVLLFALGEKAGNINGFNVFAAEEYLPPATGVKTATAAPAPATPETAPAVNPVKTRSVLPAFGPRCNPVRPSIYRTEEVRHSELTDRPLGRTRRW